MRITVDTAQQRCRWGDEDVPCAIGKNGASSHKVEGDGKSPIGTFPLRQAYFRADRLQDPQTRLPIAPLSREDGWCDDPEDPNYNRFVQLPYPGRHEKLWRDDAIYDVIVVIGYNDDPPFAGAGSAIFLHIARPDYSGTEGCIALAAPDLQRLLALCDPQSVIEIR